MIIVCDIHLFKTMLNPILESIRQVFDEKPKRYFVIRKRSLSQLYLYPSLGRFKRNIQTYIQVRVVLGQ